MGLIRAITKVREDIPAHNIGGSQIFALTCVGVRVADQNTNIVGVPHAGQCNVQLAVGKTRRREIHTGPSECLALCFVNRQGVTKAARKLDSAQVIRRPILVQFLFHWDARDIYNSALVFVVGHHLHDQMLFRVFENNGTGTVCQFRIEVVNDDDKAAGLNTKLVQRKATWCERV